jgi:putative flippase GtrA
MSALTKVKQFLRTENFFGDGLRFAIFGAVNTAITLLLFQALLFFLPPLMSYYLSWALGLVVLMVAFPAYVFRGSHLTFHRLLGTAAVYASSLALGGLLLIQAQTFGLSARLAILATLATTSAYNFLASRTIFRCTRSCVIRN